MRISRLLFPFLGKSPVFHFKLNVHFSRCESILSEVGYLVNYVKFINGRKYGCHERSYENLICAYLSSPHHSVKYAYIWVSIFVTRLDSFIQLKRIVLITIYGRYYWVFRKEQVPKRLVPRVLFRRKREKPGNAVATIIRAWETGRFCTSLIGGGSWIMQP